MQSTLHMELDALPPRPPLARAEHCSLKKQISELRMCLAKPATLEHVEHPGGSSAVGCELFRHAAGDIKIATIIASNSGRPGGACRYISGALDRRQINGGHVTQEVCMCMRVHVYVRARTCTCVCGSRARRTVPCYASMRCVAFLS